MAFRDEEVAGRARTEALEAELEALRADNAALRSGRATPRAPSTVRGAGWVAAGALGVALVAMLVTARLPIPALIVPSVLIAALATAGAVLALVMSKLLYVVRPDEVLVLVGRRHTFPGPVERGFRCVTEGRVIRLPLLETAHLLDRRPLTTERWFEGLRTRGDGSMALRLRYEARISADDARLPHAVDRFLDAEPGAVRATVNDAVEEAARLLASELDVDTLADSEHRERAADHIREEASRALAERGIDLTAVSLLEVRG